MQRLGVWLFLLIVAVAPCGGEDQDLPPGWSAARRLTLDQSACDGASMPASRGALVLRRDMSRLHGTYEKAQFRCQQRLCGHRLDDDAHLTRVLVQPCDMDPATVTRCDCFYRVDFALSDVSAGTMVELYRRWDRSGATEEPLPVLVDRALAP